MPSSPERRPRARHPSAEGRLLADPAAGRLDAGGALPRAAGRRAGDQRHRSQARPRQLCAAVHQRLGAEDPGQHLAHRRHHDGAGPGAGLPRGLRHARGDLAAAAHHDVLRAAAVLDLGPGALLRLADASGRPGRGERPVDRCRPDRRAAGAGAQRDRRADRHGPRHAALRHPHPLRQHAGHRHRPGRRGAQPGGEPPARPSAWSSCRSPGPA